MASYPFDFVSSNAMGCKAWHEGISTFKSPNIDPTICDNGDLNGNVSLRQ